MLIERSVKVKFCGIKREEDIKKALELKVDYVGFILYPKSPRFVGWERLAELLELAQGVKRVGVFVNPTLEEVNRAFELGIDLVQLHGEEDFEFAERVGLERVIKAFRVKDQIHVEEAWKQVYAILLDTYSDKAYGGTGRSFDWNIAQALVEEGFKVFLSGGLNPQNVSLAVQRVKPYAVDVSSGIEKEPGVKDHKKMEEFIHAVENSPKD
jgi:phosphoribosylanthranilate isomerase